MNVSSSRRTHLSQMLANEEHDARYSQVRDVFRERGEKRSCDLAVSHLLDCDRWDAQKRETTNKTRMASRRV